jgi:hypothetical protein
MNMGSSATFGTGPGSKPSSRGPGGVEAVAVGAARLGCDRASSFAADYATGPDLRRFRRVPAGRARIGAEVRHPPLPIIRRFLHEVCPACPNDLGKLRQEDLVGYIERHAGDWSPKTGKAMCWSLRAFLRYLHHKGLHPAPLAGCVPSIRRWKLASLPT